MTQSNIEILHRLTDAWSRGDLDAFLGALSPDVEWRFADNFIYGEANPLIGRDAIRGGSLRRIREDWDDFAAPFDELIDAGDEVVALGHYVGKHKRTGRLLNAQFAHVYTFKDGLITRWRQYVDTRQFAEVSGAYDDAGVHRRPNERTFLSHEVEERDRSPSEAESGWWRGKASPSES